MGDLLPLTNNKKLQINYSKSDHRLNNVHKNKYQTRVQQ